MSDIVVCGHSQCGAMAGLLGTAPVTEATPHLRDWLNLAKPVLEVVSGQYAHVTPTSQRLDLAVAENVLFGLDNLYTYPCVQEGLSAGTLRLHGWFFKIATAELFAYNPETRQFAPRLEAKKA